MAQHKEDSLQTKRNTRERKRKQNFKNLNDKIMMNKY
jgi:hypothetical protein